MSMCSLLLCCWKKVFAMTCAFSWPNSISLCPVSFCSTRPNLPVTPGISWIPTFVFQSTIMKLLLLNHFNHVRLCATPSLGFSRKELWSGLPFPLQCIKVKSESEVTQSCLTLRDPMDCSLPGSSILGIFQARVLEWGAIAFSTNNEKDIFLWLLVLEGLVCLHRTIQLQLLQHYCLGRRLGLPWYCMVCLVNEQRSFCRFWDCIHVLHFGLFCWLCGYYISSKGFLPTVVDIMVICIIFTRSNPF